MNAPLQLLLSCLLWAPGESDALPDGAALLDAMATELDRSRELRMEDLEAPYYLRFTVRDSVGYELEAAWGALLSSGRSRGRIFTAHVRIGSPELDNTNFTGGGGGFFGFGGAASLPLDDDRSAMRHGIWSATDAAYKQAVEMLTGKRAYLKDKTVEDRANDFSAAPAATALQPVAALEFDRAAWEQRLAALSARFREHPGIQDSSVSLSVGASHRFLVDSEGARLRSPERSARLSVSASTQAPDGQRLRDGLEYFALSPQGLPDDALVLAEIDELCARLDELGAASMLDSYTGPVLFEGPVAAQVLRQMLADGLAAVPEPVGRSRGGDALEKKLGQRILPRTVRAFDDPTLTEIGDVALAGSYAYDDEGVAAKAVELVAGGKLLDLLLSRAPTKKLSGSNGHGRSSGFFGSPGAAIANLVFEDEAGLSEEELVEELRSAAADEGLEFGLLVSGFAGGTRRTGFGGGGGSGQVKLPDPLVVHKVFVDDGRRELVRRLEFLPAPVLALKRVIAAGKEPAVHNVAGSGSRGTAGSAVVAPSLLFEELELVKVEQELDKLPLLDGPLQRGG